MAETVAFILSMHKMIQPSFQHTAQSLTMICPHCGNGGTFKQLAHDVYEQHFQLFYGQRLCPNVACNGQIFVILNGQSKIVRTYPGLKIPFNATNIPQRIKLTFDEALVCHSNGCNVASAIMIRKTLEEICEDKKTKGDNLFKRIESLKSIITLPKELMDGMHELRLLGNDAAHIETKTFDEIGNDELEISIEFTKEILKAVYQYENLLERLRSLKRQEKSE